MSAHETSTAAIIARRLLDLKRPEETDADFARRVGLTSQKIANYRAGSGISVDAVATVVARTDVNPRWLLLGEGPQRIPVASRNEDWFRRGGEATLARLREALSVIEVEITGHSTPPSPPGSAGGDRPEAPPNKTRKPR